MSGWLPVYPRENVRGYLIASCIVRNIFSWLCKMNFITRADGVTDLAYAG